METFITGTCPGCGQRNAAMIDIGNGDAMRESVMEFLDCRLVVHAIRTNNRSEIELQACLPDCPIKLAQSDG